MVKLAAIILIYDRDDIDLVHFKRQTGNLHSSALWIPSQKNDDGNVKRK